MIIVIAGFEGNKNSAKRLLDRLPSSFQKLYLKNNKPVSVSQITTVLGKADYVLAIGQKPLIKDKIYIELLGKYKETCYKTNYPIDDFITFFQGQYHIKLSENAGSSFCNHLYYHALQYINENSLTAKMLFLHIPVIDNITDFEKLVHGFEAYINSSILFNKRLRNSQRK